MIAVITKRRLYCNKAFVINQFAYGTVNLLLHLIRERELLLIDLAMEEAT